MCISGCVAWLKVHHRRLPYSCSPPDLVMPLKVHQLITFETPTCFLLRVAPARIGIRPRPCGMSSGVCDGGLIRGRSSCLPFTSTLPGNRKFFPRGCVVCGTSPNMNFRPKYHWICVGIIGKMRGQCCGGGDC